MKATGRKSCRARATWKAIAKASIAAAVAGFVGAGATACSDDHYGPPPCRTTLGNVNFTVPVAGCPKLSSWEILPAEVDVGSTVQLLATAASAVGESVQFTWSSDGGLVAEPHSASTTFQCVKPGEFPVQVSVANADAANDGCEDVGMGSVQCDPIDGGAP